VGGSCQPGFCRWPNEPVLAERVTFIINLHLPPADYSGQIQQCELRGGEYGLLDTHLSLMQWLYGMLPLLEYYRTSS